jgi:hypothetical protein
MYFNLILKENFLGYRNSLKIKLFQGSYIKFLSPLINARCKLNSYPVYGSFLLKISAVYLSQY